MGQRMLPARRQQVGQLRAQKRGLHGLLESTQGGRDVGEDGQRGHFTRQVVELPE